MFYITATMSGKDEPGTYMILSCQPKEIASSSYTSKALMEVDSREEAHKLFAWLCEELTEDKDSIRLINEEKAEGLRRLADGIERLNKNGSDLLKPIQFDFTNS